MSDASAPRRQPPSPLVFSPETVLAPISTQSNPSKHGSGQNTVSMPFIKRHVTRRLKTAKQECDKDLQRVTDAITAFFEERLREGDLDQSDAEGSRETIPYTFGDHRSSIQGDDASSDGGYDAEPEGGRHSRQRGSPSRVYHGGVTHSLSSPGLRTESLSSSPASLRRQSTLPKDRAPLSASTSALSPNDGPSRKNTIAAPTSWTTQGRASRRLSRTIHIPVRSSRSGHSSRSTSRSRSPLPANNHNSFSDHAFSTSPNRRSSRILVDDPVDPIMSSLYELVGVATDIMETTISQLTAQPKLVSQLVHRVQEVGKAWDEHPDWHGRNWYVQVLLAIASLSRVVEWWEAEKQFWNFDDDDDDEKAEPFTFLLKPSEGVAPTPTASLIPEAISSTQMTSVPEDENRLRLSRLPSGPGHSREGTQKVTVPHKSEDSPAKPMNVAESARVLATERLRLQAEQAQNHNIVLELSLDGDHFLWANYAWAVVVGSDPMEMIGTRISQILAPTDSAVFRKATEQLLSDDSHTLEVRFRIQIQPGSDAPQNRGILYREMEGKGMLMLDQIDGQPSHTMWVIKPVSPPAYDQSQTTGEDASAIQEELQASLSSDKDAISASHDEGHSTLPFARPISTAVILCRICENSIPEWFFEKHNETCNDFHKFEADIGECNESIIELRNTIREIRSVVEQSSSALVPEYRGLAILTPPTPPASMFGRGPFKNFVRNSVKRMQKRLLEQLDDILLIALEISIPSLREEESKEPIERQRLLSPTSDAKMQRIRNWSKPSSDDPALAKLISDVDTLMKAKIDNVVRMQNTIRYSEKVRQEWEEKVEQQLALQEEEEFEEEEDDDVGEDPDDAAGEDDKASTTSEYAFNGDAPASEPTPMPSCEPTPMASVSPATSSSSTPSSRGSGVRSPAPAMPIPGIHQAPGVNLYTRSSTPSSITSPLALAAPIVASSDTDNSSTSSSPKETQEKIKTIIHRKSQQALEPRVTVTPPISPHIAPRDSTGGGSTRSRRLSTITNLMSPGGSGPLSPRIPSVAPSKTTNTTIKDFEVIKPISKGAFGSVFLAKKRVTGDYFAIKVLKKADMIAKNQITNVKAERMILMNQAESPFVAKLYFTFQSKDNLYLVMEYLNGGDCAALIKTIGSLPEEWSRQYVAEVVLGLEYLHNRGIVHRDLKPDNLLIDQHGHLKLTDFGLSRIGLLGRQTRDVNLKAELIRPRGKHSPGSRPPSMDAAYLSSPLLPAADAFGGSYFMHRAGSISAPPLAASPHISIGTPTDDISESSGSDSITGFFLRRPGHNTGAGKLNESPLQSFATELTNDLRSYANPSGPGTPPGEQKFVGTPDYLAPESILGISGDDAAVDWWALGVITYEFLYGIPPFHAETPEKVFENILSGNIEWHEEFIDFTPEALDFMKKLMTVDTSKRLGANGAEEVKAHPWFNGVEWDKVAKSEAAFIPQISDPESTDYFDLRGATPQLFHDDEAIPVGQSASTPGISTFPSSSVSPMPIATHEASSPSSDDFGSFSFKNLPVLKQANDDVIRKMKTDQMAPIVHTLSEPAHIGGRPHRRSVSQRVKKPPSVVTTGDGSYTPGTNPPSPATSVSSIASSPSRGSMQPSTPGSVITGTISAHNHSRKPSEYGAVERFKQSLFDGENTRRNSAPSRLRTASVSTSGEGSMSDHWPGSASHTLNQPDSGTPPPTISTWDLKRATDPNDRVVTCLLAEDNPITAKIIETLLIRLGCRVIIVSDGSEAISVAHSDIKFDCILMDLHMPVVDGESAARHIKSTNNKNSSVPIIAVSAYGLGDGSASNLFAASLSKPVQKADLLTAMRQLGFKTSTQQDGGAPSTRVVTAR